MKKFNLWKLLFSACFACAALAFAGCVEDNDEGMPYLEVTPPQLAFDESGAPAEGSTGKFAVKTNRPWQLIVEEKDADWVRPSATEGRGSGEVSFNLPATVGGRSAKLTFQVVNPYGPYITQEVTLTQGHVVPEQLIYNETFGTTGSNTKVDAYTGWDKTGEGASTVTYGGSGCDIRSNLVSTSYSNYAGSGGSNLMFGSGETSFVINDITLPADIDTYTLTFGASYYQAPNIEIFNQLTVAFSADGQEWTEPVPYKFDGFVAGNNWNLATIDFTLAKHVDALYIKFMSTKPADGNYRIDDVKLVTSNGGEIINVGEPAPLTVSPAEVSLEGKAGATATLTVKALAAWETELSGEGFTLDVTSGEAGTATVTVTATADNASDAAVELGSIVFKSGDAAKTVTVSQQAAGSAPSGDEIVTDFTVEGTYPASGFPTSSGDKKMGPETYSFAGVTYTLAGGGSGNGYYRGKEYQGTRYYLMIGKKGAYIDLPAMADKALVSVECLVPAAASTNVKVGVSATDGTVVAGGEAIVWASQGENADRTYTYNLSGTEKNTSYRLFITADNTNGYNAQLYRLTLKYGDGGTSTAPSISVNPSSLAFAAAGDDTGKTIAVTVANQGAYNLYVKSSDNTQFPVSLSGSTVTVKALANTTDQAKNATVTVYLATAEGMTPVAEKTVAVSQEADGGTATDDIFYETFGTPVKDGNYWPYTDKNAANIKSGSGYVEGTTTYKSYSTSARIANSASSPNPPFSGEGHCWFPSGKTIDKNYFEVDKLVLKGQKNLTIQFGVYGNSSAYETGAIVLEVSGDGTTWTKLDFAVNAVEGASPEWKLAKIDFTLANAIDYLYVKWSSAVGNARMDDLRVYEGQGGTTVDLGQGGTTATLEVSPLSLSLGNAAGATKTFEIKTTAAWTATLSGSGFTLDKTSGTGDATVTVTASAANTETSVKELGSVVVAATGVAESKTVAVSQAAGSSTDPGDGSEVTVDFSRGADMASPALPGRDAAAKDGTYTIDGRTFTVHAADKFYWWENTYQDGNPASLFIGKQGSYIELPAVAGKALTGVTLVQALGGGSNVNVSVQTLAGETVTGGDAIAMNAGDTGVWTLSGTENNTSYRIYIGSSKNLHIAKLTLSYGEGGGSTTTKPEITAVDPAKIDFEAAGGTQTIAVTVADQGDNALTASGLSGLLGATVSGNTVTVTAEANMGDAVNQTLTISVAGGNSVEVPVSIAAGNTGGSAPEAGTVLWAETWASYGANSTTFTSNSTLDGYDYAGQTLYNPDGADYKVTYTADAGNAVRATTSSGANMVDGHLWFNKSAAGEWTISPIKLYGATSLTLSHAQGTSGSALEALYSIDGTGWTSLGTQSGAIAEKTYTFSVPEGTESVQIRFSHPSSNGKNTRADSFELAVGE